MKIEHYRKSDELHVKLCGELDEHHSAYVRMSLDSLLDSDGVKRLYIDMSELAFMDSTGIGFLIGRYKKAARISVPLYIEKPNFSADKILNLSGIYSLIPKAE